MFKEWLVNLLQGLVEGCMVVKGYVAYNNRTFVIMNVRTPLETALIRVTVEARMKHVMKAENL
ncbi:hypothetical protein PR048_021662 [Dryococelus australis]|uniref:Uncharacterized protein n=1 Tax=Dryococelus australis TaxID=614101 RepID=A0ABQ9GZ17_9NEOP|nr:hypothetical protein PR048_021662 [Dryococelus australis]